MSGSFMQQTASQYQIPQNILETAAYYEKNTLPSEIDYMAAQLRDRFQQVGSWEKALYEYHLTNNNDAQLADDFAAKVLVSATLGATDSGWIDKYEESGGWSGTVKPDGKITALGGSSAMESFTKDKLDGALGLVSSAGFILLGIVIIAIAILMNPKVRETAAAVVTKKGA